jgi:cytochrome P450
VQTAISKGRPIYSLFSTTDEGYHAKYRRCVNSAFSMSSLVNYEPLVDSTTDAFIDAISKQAKRATLHSGCSSSLST